MARIKYTYCTRCQCEMEGVAKFCDRCGKSDCLTVREKDDGKNALGLTPEQVKVYNQLPESLRGLFLRKEDPTDLHAQVEWIKLIHYCDPRIGFLDIDPVTVISMYADVYRENNCGEAAYMLGRCYENGIRRTSVFHRDVERSIAAAYDWYAKAANAGYFEAYMDLGRLVEQNNKRSIYNDPWNSPIKNIPTGLNTAAFYYDTARAHGIQGGEANYARLAAMGYKGFRR